MKQSGIMKHNNHRPVTRWIIISVSFMLLAACETLKVRYCEEPPATTCACPLDAPESIDPNFFCPEPSVVVAANQPNHDLIAVGGDDKLVIGQVEPVLLLPSELVLPARIDTGAAVSSINAQDMTFFERDGKSWVRFAMLNPDDGDAVTIERPVNRYTDVRVGGELQNRPVVSMTLVMGPLEEQLDVNLADRSGYAYQVLVGRNFLKDRVVVDVSQALTTTPE